METSRAIEAVAALQKIIDIIEALDPIAAELVGVAMMATLEKSTAVKKSQLTKAVDDE